MSSRNTPWPRKLSKKERVKLRSAVANAFIDGMTDEDRQALCDASQFHRDHFFEELGRWIHGDPKLDGFPLLNGKALPSAPTGTSDAELAAENIRRWLEWAAGRFRLQPKDQPGI